MSTFLLRSTPPPPFHLSNSTSLSPYSNSSVRPIAFAVCPPFPFQFPATTLKQNLLVLNRIRRRRSPGKIAARALREWQEYEEAVKDKDLARALRFLKNISIDQGPQNSSIQSSDDGMGGALESFELQRDWDVLDTCLNADDMRLVGSAYDFLKDRGRLPNFGKCRNIGNQSMFCDYCNAHSCKIYLDCICLFTTFNSCCWLQNIVAILRVSSCFLIDECGIFCFKFLPFINHSA